MKSKTNGTLRAVLCRVFMCVSVIASVSASGSTNPRFTRMSPADVAAKATQLLKELTQLGAVIRIDNREDPSRVQVACNCTPPVEPNGKTPIVVPHPVPPLDNTQLLNALTVIAALNQAHIPEMSFEHATVTIQGLR
jgi:hypothetical protein